MVRQSICFIRITTFHTSAIILIRGEMIRSGPWLVISHPCALWLPYTSQSYFPERATKKTVEIYRLWFFLFIYFFLISETADHVTEWHHGCSEATGNTLLSECVCPGMTATLAAAQKIHLKLNGEMKIVKFREEMQLLCCLDLEFTSSATSPLRTPAGMSSGGADLETSDWSAELSSGIGCDGQKMFLRYI